MKLTIFVVKFLFIGALFIISNQNLYLGVDEDREIFLDQYTSWFRNLFENLTEATGYVVNSEWLPGNGTLEG